MRKRFYVMLVARNSEGELLKIPIPLHYLYVFIAGALIGMLTITGMAGSYTRMLVKTQHFNKLRDEKEKLTKSYRQLEQIAQENKLQAASLSSLAGEVSSLYGLKPNPKLEQDDPAAASFQQFDDLRSTAMSGAASIGIAMGDMSGSTTRDWMRLVAAPTLWPVQGRVTSSFGERKDPFEGEGKFHAGIDIAGEYGTRIIAPADGTVRLTDLMNGYGKTVLLDHNNDITTLYGHLSGFAVTAGQHVHRGDTLGYVGQSGHTTGPHLHYEVRIDNTPVNPAKYLRFTFTQQVASGSM
ncbi:MAG TPA: peptidoglycan DD-metalloendopeptidase family protein [Candidatus Saccharimonadales bacterium]|nr:peptidoglycan DD-metalloendopeptidase family protein [Candidatus Saccharimonadales bacterium]